MNISAYAGVLFLGVTEISKSYDFFFITVEFSGTDCHVSHTETWWQLERFAVELEGFIHGTILREFIHHTRKKYIFFIHIK